MKTIKNKAKIVGDCKLIHYIKGSDIEVGHIIYREQGRFVVTKIGKTTRYGDVVVYISRLTLEGNLKPNSKLGSARYITYINQKKSIGVGKRKLLNRKYR